MRFFVVAAVVLAGLSHVVAAKDEPKPDGTAARLTQENDIREAVFRYQFLHNSSIQGKGAAVYCLSVGDDRADPPDDLMKRFTGFKPPVRKVSECRADPYKGVIEKRTGRHGLIFRVWKIRWISDTDVEVMGGYFEDGLSASGNTYTVRKWPQKWKVFEEKMNWLS